MTTDCIHAKPTVTALGRVGTGTLCKLADLARVMSLECAECAECADRVARPASLAGHPHAFKAGARGQAKLPAWMPRKGG